MQIQSHIHQGFVHRRNHTYHISGLHTSTHTKNTPLSLPSGEIPGETVALSLAAPAIAVTSIAAQQPIIHTAPLLPTPPSLLGINSGIGASVLGTPPTQAAAAAAAFSAAMATPGLAGIAPGMVNSN